jgi:hypothetical protein
MKKTLILLFIILLCGYIAYRKTGILPTSQTNKIDLGSWHEKQIDRLLNDANKIKNVSEKIDFISLMFLNTKYKGETLIGDKNTKEVFVINLREVDCFTFIDYVEAMRRSLSFNEFKRKLKNVRYQKGIIDFSMRNHFFTDWAEFNSDYIVNVTEKIGEDKTKKVEKDLNHKKDGTFFLLGLPSKKRTVAFIPSSELNADLTTKLKTGDYIGIYTDIPGLDVTHVGIIIKKDKIYFRHATPKKGLEKVVDTDFKKYIANKPGIVILRPID